MEEGVHVPGVGFHTFVNPPFEEREETSGEGVGFCGTLDRIDLHAGRLEALVD